MRLKENIDLPGFLSAVKACAGEVFFETADGDSLALRSSFCCYIFCLLINQTPALLYQGTLRLENPKDAAALADFLSI